MYLHNFRPLTGPVHGGKVLLNGSDQGGLGSVGTSVSMCLQVAPHKIVQRIKIRTARRPAVLRVYNILTKMLTKYSSKKNIKRYNIQTLVKLHKD
jgi:hypothetical protein